MTSTELKMKITVGIDEFIKINRDSIYSATTNPQTIAGIATGALYVVFRATENNDPRFSAWSEYDARLRYYD